jgi:hypothetical protein
MPPDVAPAGYTRREAFAGIERVSRVLGDFQPPTMASPPALILPFSTC